MNSKSSSPFTKAPITSPRLKALTYGPQGSGKTHLAVATACYLAEGEGKRVAAINLEGGVDYLPALGFDFDYVSPDSLRDTMKALDYLLSDEGQRIYGAIVIDACTVLYHAAQDEQMEIVEKRSGARRDEASLSVREWGKIRQWFERLGVRLARTSQHVIVTARESEIKNKDGEVAGQKADIHKTWVSLFDFSGRVTRDGDRRSLKWDKDRTAHKLPSVLNNPKPEDFAFALMATDGKHVTAAADMAIDEVKEETVGDIRTTMHALRNVNAEVGGKYEAHFGRRQAEILAHEGAALDFLARLNKALDESKNAQAASSEEATVSA